jgi:PAS domain S-box-containing protein
MRVWGSIEDFAAERRKRNARALSLALAVLGAFGVVACELAGAPRSATLATLAQAVLCLIAYLAIRWGRFVPGVVVMMLGPIIQHVAIVGAMGKLTVLPFISTLVVLLAAATLPLKRLYLGVLLALLAILVEATLVDLTAKESMFASGLLAGALLFLGVAAVISVLHVHGTERAMALAREREDARERAAAAARASEERYRLIAENTIDLIALLDAQGRPTYLSPSHERVLGFPPEELAERAFVELVVLDYRSSAARCLAEALSSGRSSGELALLSKPGKELLFDSTFTRVRTDKGDLVTVLSRNITERRAMEEDLQRAGRMEALGRMARGIAHDFNNLLATMLGNAELAEVELPPEHPARAALASVREAAQSAARLTQQLLAFSRNQTRPVTEIYPAIEISKLTPLLASVVGKGVNLAVDVVESCPPVLLHGGHFEQLVLNLGSNAAHAMDGQGTLRIGLKLRAIAPDAVANLKAGDYVELSVADSGVGIPPDVLPHVFEPFYTTRSGAGGIGLGLASCYGIATQQGGQILVESQPGQGTTFRVLLPVASHGGDAALAPATTHDKGAAPADPPPSPPAAPETPGRANHRR